MKAHWTEELATFLGRTRRKRLEWLMITEVALGIEHEIG